MPLIKVITGMHLFLSLLLPKVNSEFRSPGDPVANIT